MTAALAGCSGGGSDGGAGYGGVTDTAEPTATDTSESAIALTVTDVETETRTIAVPEAAIDAPGWLVVHPEAEGGGPNGGVVLAGTQLAPGTHEDVRLELDAVTTDGATVYAMLHYDDPRDGEFTFPRNGDPPVESGGSPVVRPFDVTLTGDVAPALSVADQTTDGSTLTVPAAAVDAPGWLVVHPEADGGGPNGGVVLAKRRLEAGKYADLTLPTTSSLSEGGTLYGMLHYDDPDDGEFTFPQNGDPPVESGGSPVVRPFDVGVGGGATTVTAVDTSFDPVRASVEPGTTVEWVNEDPYGHDVTSATFHEGATDWNLAKTLPAGGTVKYTFADPGVYEYYCTIHGEGTMCGVVLVGDVSLDADLPCES